MSERSTDVLLEDMRECLDKIFRYTEGMDEGRFIENTLVVDAVLRNIEVLGEAASRLPDKFIGAHPEVAWRGIIGMRNRLIHGYFGVSLKLVWHIIQKDMPDLRKELNRI